MHISILACAIVALAWYGFTMSGHSSADGDAISSMQPNSGNGTLAEQTLACPLESPADCEDDVAITLIKFHGNSQCTSCINLGKFANATLQKRYAAELASGSIRYLDVNAEAEPNNELVLKYRPTHSSLYLLVNRSGVESVEELAQAWYYTGDESAYSQYLSGIIDESLQ